MTAQPPTHTDTPAGSHSSATPPRLVQLDALRAFAIAGVLVHHFAPAAAAVAPVGPAGVKLFFVLSGYLITGILLNYRDQVDGGAASGWGMIRKFYFRRFLRIFPVYFFVLGLTMAIGYPPVRETFWWHATYLTNVYIATTGVWPGFLSPFWTLAVEEQFYLVWPWVVLFAPRRHLWRVVVGMIASAVLFRAAGVAAGLDPNRVCVLPAACLDTLGMGALLAILRTPVGGCERSAARLTRLGLWLGAPLLAVMLVIGRVPALGGAFVVGFDLAMGLVAVWLIAGASQGFVGFPGCLLNLRALTHIGLISYGIYVYHSFVPGAVLDWLNQADPTTKRILALLVGLFVVVRLLASRPWSAARAGGIPPRPDVPLLTVLAALVLVAAAYGGMHAGLHSGESMNAWIRFVLSSGCSILAAELSWRLLESPINQVKRSADAQASSRDQRGLGTSAAEPRSSVTIR